MDNITIPFELQALSEAENYQRWIFETVEPFIGNRVLELGAGIGNMSRWIPFREKLILSENDPNLMELLINSIETGPIDNRVEVQKIDITSSDVIELSSHHLDTIISFNVLEHIENDKDCLTLLVKLMKKAMYPGQNG